MPAFIPDDNIKKVPGVQPLQTKVELTKYRPLKFTLGKPTRSNFNGKFSIPQFKIPIPGEGLPRVVHYLADQGGCAFWRLIWPGDELLSQNKAVVMSLYQMIQQAQFYLTVDVVRLQRQCTDHQREFVEFLRAVSDNIKQQTGKGFKILYEVDDICMPVDSIPDYNPCKQAFLDPKIGENMKKIVALCDEMTVPSQTMKDHYVKHLGYDKISVVPNYAPQSWLDKGDTFFHKIKEYRDNKKRPRIAYAGSSTHFDYLNKAQQKDDFDHVINEIIKDVTITKKYQWVFLGGYPPKLKQYIDSKQVEYHPWGPVSQYPKLLKKLNAQILIAPLADNVFSNAKANIKLTEGGALGIPVVAQDRDCYKDALYKFETADEMFKQFNRILLSENTYRQAVDNSRAYAEKFWLEDHTDEWMLIYNTPYGDPKRKENKFFLENNPDQFE